MSLCSRHAHLLSRISRFQCGWSIAQIAADEGVSFHTVYDYLRKQEVISNRYLSDEFEKALREDDTIPSPVREYQFVQMAPIEKRNLFRAPKTGRVRAWATDFAFPWHKLAIEIDGGSFMKGGGPHAHDREKRNAYAVLGWRVLYFDTKQLEDPVACVEIVRLALKGE
jgi:very-short-patch-repair endonuclease